jgi:hypothetical protein
MRALVVIHGVGPAVPGGIARTVATTLGLRQTRQSVVCLDGHSYVELVDEKSGIAIIEVNWTDLVQTRANPWGVLLHLWYVVTSMLDIAAHDVGERRSRLIRVYRTALLTITPGAVAFTLSTAIAVAFATRWQRMLLLALLLIAWTGLVSWLQTFGKHFRWLWPWVPAVAAVAIAATTGPIPADGQLMWLALQARGIGFGLVFVTLTLGFVEAIGSPARSLWGPRLARGAFLYLPFIALNALMTWVTFLCLYLISKYGQHYDAWERAATPHLDYAGLELATTFVIGGIGILGLVLPLVGYALFRDSTTTDNPRLNQAGRGAQDGIRDFLVVAPLALIALAIFTVYIKLTTDSSPIGVLDIYRNSIWRTIPYLGWLVGPFAIALNVVGDVLFYARPADTHPAAIGPRCRDRLLSALVYAGERFGGNVVLLAHSQGSVIASDLRLTAGLEVPLVTVGSPVHSLYRRFLGVEGGGAKVRAPWINGYRDGDFIAGPIARDEVVNTHMGTGGHIDYWSAPELRKVLPPGFFS